MKQEKQNASRRLVEKEGTVSTDTSKAKRGRRKKAGDSRSLRRQAPDHQEAGDRCEEAASIEEQG